MPCDLIATGQASDQGVLERIWGEEHDRIGGPVNPHITTYTARTRPGQACTRSLARFCHYPARDRSDVPPLFDRSPCALGAESLLEAACGFGEARTQNPLGAYTDPVILASRYLNSR